MVDICVGLERDAGCEPISHWIGLDNGAGGQHGDDSIHGPVAGYITAGLRRGDRLGLGHIRQVHGAKRAEIETGEYDCVESRSLMIFLLVFQYTTLSFSLWN